MSSTGKTFSSTLFVDASGKQLCFCLSPCPARKLIQPLVEQGGGIVTSTIRNDIGTWIRLMPPGSRVHDENAVSCKYIVDCTEQNQLLDLTPYRLAIGATCDVTNEEKVVLRTQDMTAGRTPYTDDEDRVILNYVLENKLFSMTGGNKVWQQMEKKKVMNRSWHSIRTRFRTYILPNIESYELSAEHRRALCKSAKSVAEGSVETSSTQKSDSFSIDHLDEESSSLEHRQSLGPCTAKMIRNKSEKGNAELGIGRALRSSANEVPDSPRRVTRQSVVCQGTLGRSNDELYVEFPEDEEQGSVEFPRLTSSELPKTRNQIALSKIVPPESVTNEEQGKIKTLPRTRDRESASKNGASGPALPTRQSPRKSSLDAAQRRAPARVDEKAHHHSRGALNDEYVLASTSGSAGMKRSLRGPASKRVETITSEQDSEMSDSQTECPQKLRSAEEEEPTVLEERVLRRKTKRGTSFISSSSVGEHSGTASGKAPRLQTIEKTSSVDSPKAMEETDVDECDRTLPSYGQKKHRRVKKSHTRSANLLNAPDGSESRGRKTFEASPQKAAERMKTLGGKVARGPSRVDEEKFSDEGHRSAMSLKEKVDVVPAVRAPVGELLVVGNASNAGIPASRSKQSDDSAVASEGRVKKDKVASGSSKPVTTLIDVVMSSQAESWHTAVSERSPAVRDLESDDDDDGGGGGGGFVRVHGRARSRSWKGKRVTPAEQEEMASNSDKDKEAAQQPSDGDSETEQRQLDEKFNSIQRIARWLGLSDEEFIQVLCMANGSVDDAIYWVQNGTLKSGREIWNAAADDDKLVNCASDDTLLQLIEKYGEETVNERLKFLAPMIQ